MSVAARRGHQDSPEGEMSLAQIVAEMQRLRGIMDKDRSEIERLKAESNAIKVETQNLLKRLEASIFPC